MELAAEPYTRQRLSCLADYRQAVVEVKEFVQLEA
jgi:hypothetical protein